MLEIIPVSFGKATPDRSDGGECNLEKHRTI
jgi:hypothetical protein